MNYIKKLVNENKLNALKFWMEKYIPNVDIDFTSTKNYLVMVIKDKKGAILDNYLLTNYSCKRFDNAGAKTIKSIPAVKVEGCYFSFMCESFQNYQGAFIDSLKSEEADSCEIY